MNNLDGYKLVTYPRTGSHYLRELLLQSTGKLIYKTHDPLDFPELKTITILREPLGTLKSELAMSLRYGITNTPAVSQYIKFFNYMNDNASIVIDYEDLIKYPEKVCKSLSNKLGVKYLRSEYVDTLKDNPDNTYIVTSRNTKEYDSIDMSKYYLGNCYMIYNTVKTNKNILEI